MNFKLLATDLDGTLLNDNKEISFINYEALEYAVNKGIILVPCTGRAVNGITKYDRLAQLSTYAIAYNGAMIINLKNNEIIYHCPLDKKDVFYIVNRGIQYNTNICIWSNNKLYCNVINDYTMSYSKISGIAPEKFNSLADFESKIITKVLWHDSEESIAKYLKEMSNTVSESVCCCTPKPWFLEFFNSQTSKALALDKLNAALNIKQSEVIAFGDELNDVSLIKYAGTGVAMANARKEVKLCADIITSSNNDDGVAQIIHKLI
ncbi:Cof-type HAD-IIB family hydrolase [Oscillospiraceae bacterium LCP25S3_E3]